jgi:endo-1,4-beta-xylanase
MRRIFSILAGLIAMPACVMAQALPTAPSAGYDQGGRFPAGPVNDVTYYSTVAGRDLVMKVYTPPGYSTNQKYGVVYAYQGISTDPGTIFADWCVGAGIVCDNLVGEGKISKGVIIVAVDDQFNGTYGSDVRGMTINDVIPYIDSHYSTYADADHRGVYGYSWGGGYAFNVGCGSLDTFRHIAPSSAAPSKAGDESLFPNGGAEAKQKMKLLLIACGNADYLGLYGPSEGAHNYCVSNGIPHAWWPVNGGGHDGGVWRPHMWNFLQMADQAGISDPSRTRSAYSQFEAESADSQSGGSSEGCSEGGSDLGSIVNGNYIVFRNVDFTGGATNFQARVASATGGGNIEVRLDATNGTLVGTCAVTGTGGWQTWVTRSIAVSGATGGVHNVYLMFTGGSGYLFNVNWWKFGGPGTPVSAPTAPGGLVATAGIERAALRWNASGTATSYNVKRAATSGGTYTTIANVAGTNYTDRGVFGGTTNYYKVSALNIGGESADSSPASVTPTATVPAPWLTRDVGAVGLSGSASFTNGIFTVMGSGADIGGTNDAFRFIHVATNGDCTIVARVASLESHINSASKAGVMIRESLDTNAANAFIGVTPGNGVVFQYRSSTGGGSFSNNATGMSAPYWVKLVRSGNTFTGSYSSDGSSWTQLGSATFTMAATEQVGLALTSHNLYTLCTATIDRVTGPGWAPPYPTTPTGLAATAGIEQVALKWNASLNATSYNVKRATSGSGPFTTVANVTATNCTDTRLIGRTKYYYVVSAVNSLAGESDNSAQVNATPTVNVPLPWNTQDIGNPGLWGSAGVTNGVFTINGSGGDIWGTADAFRFVYVTNSSDCTVIARVASVQYSDSWAKAGIMVRESLAANAVNAFVAVTPGNGVTWQYRSSTGGGSTSATTTGLGAPYWVKLVRSGNTFTGYRSPNGTTWTQMGSVTLTNISSAAYIGLAVTAHNNSALCTATFDNVSLPGWPPPVLVADAVAASSTQVSVTWNNLTNATSYSVKRSLTSGGPYTTIASGLTATNYSDSVASVRAGYYYVVSAVIGGGETNSPEAAVRILKLTGGIIGTAGSWNNFGNTITNVFDGDLATYFDAPNGDGAWVGLDFGAGVSNVITKINYCPRSANESRMVGGVFQGANNASFTGAVTLYTITNSPVAGVFTSVNITNTAGFRYVRYLSPTDGWGNVAELEFYGYLFSASVAVPTGLSAQAVSTSQINLTWNAFGNATGYNVKRSLTNGGPYAVVASGVTATNYSDSGLAGGTMYYYVVNAVVGGTNSVDSAQATATTLSGTLGSLVHRYSFSETSGASIADSVGGPIWNGTLPSGGTLSGSQLGLASASSQYAVLPTGIVSSLSNFTIMVWVNLTSVSDWSRIFDFGSDTTANMFLTPQCGGSGTLRFAITTGGGWAEQQINSSSTLSLGAWHQVAVTLNSGTGILYVDGVAVGTNSDMTITPSSLGSTVNNYLGKSQYPDPYLNGSLDEFRIYNCALTAADVALMNAGGPSQTRLAGTVTLGSLSQTYNGTARSATATTTPTNLTVNLTYNGSANAPTNAGSYTVIGTISDTNYQGSATNTLVIGKGAGTVTLGSLSQTYNGTARSATATTTPSGLTVNLTYNGSASAPTNAGSYTVIGTISDANYQGSATNTLVIGKATGTVTLGSLSQTYNGTARSASATTTPVGLTVNLTYNGSANAPTNVGSYTVIGTISDANYQGSATDTLVIADAAPPQMSLAQVGTNLTVSWPLECAGYTLQSCTNLMQGNWENVASPAPQIVGGQWEVTLPQSGNTPSVFYRLLK